MQKGRAERLLNGPRALYSPLVDAGVPGTGDPGALPVNAAELRRSKRRLAEAANRGERATQAIPPIKCRAHCGRRLAKLLTAPRHSEVTPDGVIESSRFNSGPELSIFGPTDQVDGEIRVRRTESPTAPELHLSLVGRTEPIVIVCRCGRRNVLDPIVLTQVALVRRLGGADAA